MIRNLFLVGLGGALGSILRYGSSLVINSKYYPWSTLVVNITGSLVIGLVVGISYRNEAFSYNWKLFLTTGICGGFTTFSAFSIENMALLQNDRYLVAFSYITGSVLFGIMATWIGYKIGGGN